MNTALLICSSEHETSALTHSLSEIQQKHHLAMNEHLSNLANPYFSKFLQYNFERTYFVD